MTAVDVETPPFVLTKPSIMIGTSPAMKELRCAANQITHAIDQGTNDYDTYCGSYRSYGVARHTLTITIYQNFDTDGPWQVLKPLENTVVDFTLLPDDNQASGPTNPLMFGKVRVPAIPFLDAGVNEASSIDIELSIQGTPSFAPPDTAPALAATAGGTEPTSSGPTGGSSSAGSGGSSTPAA